ncbi:MAG: hypothetical protein HC805_03180 [Alkalinema sp. RL_2_19]|nr:hypothetical protein [Alkalinema sp. RL_2_19]
MAATLEQIAGYLDKKGWKYRIDEETSRIHLRGSMRKRSSNFLIIIQLDEEGEFFEVYAPRVITGVKEHPYKSEILQTMLCISWETKMLQWEYDPADGEIRAIIEFPLEDAELTERQFNRCLYSLVQLVDELALPRLQMVMATGEDPGDVHEGERLLLQLETESPGFIDLWLEKAMEARKRRGRLLPDDDLN